MGVDLGTDRTREEADVMPKPPDRALRIILIFSLLAAAGGLLFIFSGKPLVMRLFLSPPESEVSTLLVLMMKEMGGFSLMLSLMLFFASRDPARNVAIVNAVIVGLCVLALTPCCLSIRWISAGFIRAT